MEKREYLENIKPGDNIAWRDSSDGSIKQGTVVTNWSHSNELIVYYECDYTGIDYDKIVRLINI